MKAKKKKVNDEFKRGAEVAAGLADEYNGSSTHASRLGDCILCKLNLITRNRPRKNEKKLQDPKDAFAHGMVLALAELHRLKANSADIRQVADAAGLTVKLAKDVGADPYDWRELKKAGVSTC